MSWWVIFGLAAGAYALKAFGLLGLSRIELTGPLADLVRLLPAAMFAGLVMQQTLTGAAVEVIATRSIRCRRRRALCAGPRHRCRGRSWSAPA